MTAHATGSSSWSPHNCTAPRSCTGRNDMVGTISDDVTEQLERGTASLPDIMGDAVRHRVAAIFRPRVSSERSSSLTRGVLAIATAVAAMLAPEISLVAMLVVFSAYAVADAGLAIVTAMRVPEHRWRLLAQGAIDLAVVGFMTADGDVTRRTALSLLAVWVVVMGVLRFRDAFEVHDGRVHANPLLATLAILAVVAGLEAIVAPVEHIGVVMVNAWIFTILRGVTLIVSAKREA